MRFPFRRFIEQLQVHRAPWRVVVLWYHDHPRAPFDRLWYGLDRPDAHVSVQGVFDGSFPVVWDGNWCVGSMSFASVYEVDVQRSP